MRSDTTRDTAFIRGRVDACKTVRFQHISRKQKNLHHITRRRQTNRSRKYDMDFGNKNTPMDMGEKSGGKQNHGKMSHHDERHMTKLIKNKLKNKDALTEEEYAFAEEHDMLMSKEEKHMMKEVKAKLKKGESLYEDEKKFAAEHELLS